MNQKRQKWASISLQNCTKNTEVYQKISTVRFISEIDPQLYASKGLAKAEWKKWVAQEPILFVQPKFLSYNIRDFPMAWFALKLSEYFAISKFLSRSDLFLMRLLRTDFRKIYQKSDPWSKDQWSGESGVFPKSRKLNKIVCLCKGYTEGNVRGYLYRRHSRT